MSLADQYLRIGAETRRIQASKSSGDARPAGGEPTAGLDWRIKSLESAIAAQRQAVSSPEWLWVTQHRACTDAAPKNADNLDNKPADVKTSHGSARPK